MFDNVEQAFKQLDEKEYHYIATELSAFRGALTTQRFTPDESFQLTRDFAKYLYHTSMESMMFGEDDDDDLEDELEDE